MKTIPSFVLLSFFFSCVKREFNEEFEIGRRRGVRCTARRLDVCGRKVDGGLEARRAVLPRARRKQEEGGAGGRIFFARSRVAPKRWSLASSLCVASAFCDSEKRTTLSMSGSGHRGVLHAISKSNAPQLLNYCRHSRRNRRRRENARLRVFPQENSCLIFLVEKTEDAVPSWKIYDFLGFIGFSWVLVDLRAARQKKLKPKDSTCTDRCRYSRKRAK